MTILEQTEQAIDASHRLDTPSETLNALESQARILAARMDAILAALDNPYWVCVPYEPSIHAVRQLAAQAHEIAEGKHDG